MVNHFPNFDNYVTNYEFENFGTEFLIQENHTVLESKNYLIKISDVKFSHILR